MDMSCMWDFSMAESNIPFSTCQPVDFISNSWCVCKKKTHSERPNSRLSLFPKQNDSCTEPEISSAT